MSQKISLILYLFFVMWNMLLFAFKTSLDLLQSTSTVIFDMVFFNYKAFFTLFRLFLWKSSNEDSEKHLNPLEYRALIYQQILVMNK